ncbi:hypothetical protein DMUE_0750 [Dictyocoela muelleri]|nr:hypothetical protein DMUE_0750 [Dictyocoela muelleri]
MFSRFTETKILFQIISKNIPDIFRKVVKATRMLLKCLMVNGKQFTSKIFSSLLIKNKIIHIKYDPYNPTGNSVVERVNQEIGLVFRIYRGCSLANIEEAVYRRINLTINSTTGIHP